LNSIERSSRVPRKLLIFLLIWSVAAGALAVVPIPVQASYKHSNQHKYQVFFRKPKSKKWRKYGAFTSAAAAVNAAQRLRARGFEAKVS
jgi:hypothetical protein